MRKYIFFLILVSSVVSVLAIPAKKGVKKTITLSDGTQVKVTLCGDEHLHFWKADDGRRFRMEENSAKEISIDEFSILKANAIKRKTAINKTRALRMTKAKGKALKQEETASGTFVGSKKGLVILVNYSDLKMTSPTAMQDFYDQFNQEGYSKNGHIGSVHDYFTDQSYGQFDLTFDVVGPVTVSRNYKYYGGNDSNGEDKYPATMVIEACNLVDDAVNFADYDWDGDGFVDQVYVIYAGYGETASDDENTIWPHEYTLQEAKVYKDGSGPLQLDGVWINTYATSCELAGDSGSTMNGIGTACHEFSHCLGFPDFYDTSYTGGWGMQAWDLLDSGSYNGPDMNGEVPAGYTSYERWVAGWLTPAELKACDEVKPLKSLGDTAQAYIIYNDSVANEYYLLENRKPDRWFEYCEDNKMTNQGMLVIHVDYDEDAWYESIPNDDPDHQRMTVVHANGEAGKGSFNSSNGFYYLSASQYAGNLYPYNDNDSLTSNSVPATDTFTACKNKKNFLPVAIKDIETGADGSMTFIATEPYFGPEPEPSGIKIVYCEENDDKRIYSITGQYLGTDMDFIPKGIYIINGRIILKK